MYYMLHVSRIISIFGCIRVFILFTFVMLMNKDEQKKIATMTTTIFAWIIGISLVAYLLVFAGIDMPYSVINKPDNTSYPPFINYGLFITYADNMEFLQKRFQSIFTEPGQFGTIGAIFLYINRYELRRRSILIIFISVLMSFSLAAYVLLVIGYLIYIVTRNRKVYRTITKIILITALLGGSGYYCYLVYPEFMVSRLILSRLEYSEDRGIRGNNRTSDEFNHYYKTKFLTSTTNILWGKSLNEAEQFFLRTESGSGYKVFLYQHGVISMILLLLLYWSIVFVNPSRLGFGLLLLCCISFLQRPSTALWSMQLFLFVGAIQYFHTAYLDYDKENKSKT
jgi:hypothetical protein